jgi:hypothetical protein
MQIQGEQQWGGASGNILKARYQPFRPAGSGRYVGLRKKRSVPSSSRVLTREDIHFLNQKLAQLQPFSLPQGAACLYGVPSRGIWQAILSCLISQGLTLGESAKLGHEIYQNSMVSAARENLSAEEAIARALTMAHKIGQELKGTELSLKRVFETKASPKFHTETKNPSKPMKKEKRVMSDDDAFQFYIRAKEFLTELDQQMEPIFRENPGSPDIEALFKKIDEKVEKYNKGDLPEDFFDTYKLVNLAAAKNHLDLFQEKRK